VDTLTLDIPPEFVEQLAQRAAEILRDQQSASGPEPWLDVQAAADHLSCPKSRIYALVSARRIPHHRDGSRLLFRTDELDKWIVNEHGGKRP
jgi:excisionase family DNA binding protein